MKSPSYPVFQRLRSDDKGWDTVHFSPRTGRLKFCLANNAVLSQMEMLLMLDEVAEYRQRWRRGEGR